MAAEDYFDIDGYWDGFGDPDTGVTCKYCGVTDLAWFQRKGKWILVDEDGEQHRCKAFRQTAAQAFS